MAGPSRKPRSVAMVAALATVAGLALSACTAAVGSGAPVLTWYINPDGGGSDPTKGGQAQLAKECTDAADGRYSIQIQLLPNSASDQRQQLLRRLAAKDTGMDLMSMDPVFVAEFAQAGFLAPVPAADADTMTKDAVRPAVQASTWRGRLVAAPMWANTQVLWYRKSVAQAAGLDMNKPVTWDQLIAAAKSQQKTIGVQARRYEGYMVWINALIEGAGGHIIENPGASADELRFGLDSPAGQEAAAVIQKVAQAGVAGPAMGSLDETGALDLFSNDATSGFLVNWPYVWAALPGKNVDWIDDVGWARYPRTVEGKESRPPFGGIELGVNAASTHQPEAWDAIKCIITPEHQTLYMKSTGNPAANKTVYDDPAIRKQFPMADLIRESLDGGAPRPITQYYGDVSSAIQRVFSPPDSVDPATTPRQAQDLIESVLKGEALL
ncbi:extracellular solute-binding protein [Intrasporangium sp.]|uniref:extracellular solute-binding protein n=1 Tax=Intrasporangium sp. TaxID=1925024 RepID=UPI0032221389